MRWRASRPAWRSCCGPLAGASVARQIKVRLFRKARAQVTLARMSLAVAAQISGLGMALCMAMYAWMATFNLATLALVGDVSHRFRLHE